MKQLLLFIIAGMLLGCSKEVKRSDLSDIAGDYHWFYSHDNYFESIYPSSTSDKYGIRIKSRSKVVFYTNSEKEMSLKINSVYETENGGKAIIVQWTDVLERGIIIEGNTLTFYDWPTETYYNKFSKSN